MLVGWKDRCGVGGSSAAETATALLPERGRERIADDLTYRSCTFYLDCRY